MGIQHQRRDALDDDRKRRSVEQQQMDTRSYARRESGGGQGLASYQSFADDDDEALNIARRCSSFGAATLLTEYEMSTNQVCNRLGDSAAVETSVPSVQSEIPRPGQVFMAGLSGEPTSEPPFRPMVGGGAAAAYNALRFDFYMQKQRAAKQKRRMSSLSMGSAKLNTKNRFNSSGNNNSSYIGNSNERAGGARFEE